MIDGRAGGLQKVYTNKFSPRTFECGAVLFLARFLAADASDSASGSE